MRATRPLAATIAALLSVLSARAQDAPPRTISTDFVSPIREHVLGEHLAPELWGGGRNYKVSFHDGPVFYPHVGAALPHQPVRWTTTSIELDGRPLPVADRYRPVRRDDTVCEFDLGPVSERYEVRLDGLEQTFVLDAPLGTGSLTIRGAVDSPLHVDEAPPRAGRALPLRRPDGTTVVEYGAAIVYDAAGRRVDVTTAVENGEIVLRVAADFLAEAAYPVVVDPLFVNRLLESGAPMRESDVVHEELSSAGAQGRTWVVFSRLVATGDQDLWIYRVDSDMTGTPQVAFENLTVWSYERGRIAVAPGPRRVVAVFEVRPNVDVTDYIAVHAHGVDDFFTRTNHVPAFGNGLEADRRPDIGGRHDGGEDVLIVFERDRNTGNGQVRAGVWDASFGTSGQARFPDFVIRAQANRDQRRPTVNSSAAGPVWVTAFQRHDGTVANDDWDLAIQAIDASGNVSPSNLTVEQQDLATWHKTGPILAGANGRYCLGYTLREFELPNPKPTGIQGEELWLQRIDWDHQSDVGSLVHEPVLLDSAVDPDLRFGRIAFDPVSESHWCVVTNRPSTSGERIDAIKVGYRGQPVEQVAIANTGSRVLETGGTGFDLGQRRFLVTYGANTTFSSNAHWLRGVVIQNEQVAAPQTYGFACGSGVFTGVAGIEDRQQIGAQGMRLRLTGAPQSGVAVLAIALGRADIPLANFGMPGCRWLTSPGTHIAAVQTLMAAGNAAIALDLPESTPPVTLNFQWFYEAQGANPTGLLASDGLEVEIGR